MALKNAKKDPKNDPKPPLTPLKMSHRHFSKSFSPPKICSTKKLFFTARLCIWRCRDHWNQQDASITWCDPFRPNFGKKTSEIISVRDAWEPWKQALLASRDVMISSQFAARIRRGFFTLGDGCWLPMKWWPKRMIQGIVCNILAGMEDSGSSWTFPFQSYRCQGFMELLSIAVAAVRWSTCLIEILRRESTVCVLGAL